MANTCEAGQDPGRHMLILVTGSSGLVGTAVVDALTAAGHESIVLVRRAPHASEAAVQWDPAAGTIDATGLEGVEGVVHLAGEGIAERRWTDAQKSRILRSRTDGTTLLATTLAGLSTPPSVLVSGSAIGAYGDRGDERLTETSTRGDDFLADVVRQWESATAPAIEAGIRVVHARSGIVLSAAGGALAEQLPFFRLGIGGRVGSGRQWMSWISIMDEARALVWLLDHDVGGPVNLVAPGAVTNREFTTTLGSVLRRPTLLPIPKPILWARLGRELTAALLYASARVDPKVLTDAGFTFTHADLEPALRCILDRPIRKDLS
jgi:uncharacterized protein (TIGR01777 family)